MFLFLRDCRLDFDFPPKDLRLDSNLPFKDLRLDFRVGESKNVKTALPK